MAERCAAAEDGRCRLRAMGAAAQRDGQRSAQGGALRGLCTSLSFSSVLSVSTAPPTRFGTPGAWPRPCASPLLGTPNSRLNISFASAEAKPRLFLHRQRAGGAAELARAAERGRLCGTGCSARETDDDATTFDHAARSSPIANELLMNIVAHVAARRMMAFQVSRRAPSPTAFPSVEPDTCHFRRAKQAEDLK